jgi:hypothetical protein
MDCYASGAKVGTTPRSCTACGGTGQHVRHERRGGVSLQQITICPECGGGGSTGLKICGGGEWLDAKHGSRSRRRWRKLHIGINTDTHEVVVAELTPDDVGDVSTIAGLLEQIDNRVASLTADGAYDGEAVYDAVTKRHPAAAVI